MSPCPHLCSCTRRSVWGQEGRRPGFQGGLESKEGAVPGWERPAWAETAPSRVRPVSWHECEPCTNELVPVCAKLCVRDQTCPGNRSCHRLWAGLGLSPSGYAASASTGQGANGAPVAGPAPGAEECGWERPDARRQARATSTSLARRHLGPDTGQVLKGQSM